VAGSEVELGGLEDLGEGVRRCRKNDSLAWGGVFEQQHGSI